MKVLLGLGVILIVLGVASLFVPIPQRDRHGIEVGSVSVGFETERRDTVHPGISAVLIGGGVALLLLGRGRSR